MQIEIGPKGKRVVAVAREWPGLSRGDKTEEAAIDRLQSYLPRYAHIARLAGLESEFADASSVDVIDHYPGTGSTDFWGISFGFSDHDRQLMSIAELDRELALLQACWACIDDAGGSVSEIL